MRAPRALAAFSLGLAGFAFAGCHSERSASAPRAGSIRPVEPRLSESDGYAPCPVDRRSSSSSSIPTAVCASPPRARRESHRSAGGGGALRGGASEVPKAAEGSSDLGGLLSAADDRVLNRAIRGLERISGADPRAARRWSDLAAAYLVRSQRADDPRDLLRAYGAADRAVQEDGALPAARFNRALALERLFLVPEAIAAWRDYLYLDRTSGWAMEAQSHLRTLDRPSPGSEWEQQRQRLEQAAVAGDPGKVGAIVHQYRQAAREHAEQELFGLWADAVVAGRQELAAGRLRLLHRLGDALVEIEGEHLVQDSVAAIDAVSAGGDPARWRDLVQGHRILRDGYLAYHARNVREAVEKLSAAREALARAGSPLALQAEFFLVCCDYLNDRYSRGLAAAKQLARKVQGPAYGGLRGYVFRVQAVLEEGLGQTWAAAEDYGKALAEFRALGEGENVAHAGCMVGRTLSFLGREQQAWRYVYQALRTLPELRDATARANVLMIAGDTALRDGADAAALAFDQARVRESFRAGPLAAVEALLWLARMQEHREDRRSALATLEEARARVGRLEDPRTRRRRQADLAMIEGEMRTQDDPRQAVSLLTSALAVYQRDKNFLFSLRTLLARGRAQRQMGDVREAERDLGAALALYDRLGEQLKQEDFRLPFLEETDAVFDEMVSLQAGRDPDLAFAYADRARTRVLPGTASALWTGGLAATGDHLPVEPQSLPLDEIRRRLPAGITLVQYSVLPDRVLIWILRHDEENPRFFVQHGSRAELNLKAARLQEFATGTWEPAAEDLFDRLVRPWLAAVPAGERIVFVPDKVLHRIPFATLRDRATKRLLVEDHPVAIAPSATLYVRALERQAGERKTSRSAGLVIGDPAVDHFLFPDLSSLRESADEARRVAAMTGSRLVTGSAATKSVFLAEASQADWIHFSGHALVDPRNPLLSMLVLTPESKGDPGVLTAQEIYALKLGRTRLVVLAACDTGNEYIPGGEGATSLARAFLAAGVPTVVASLWSVDDRATSVLFDAFHRSLLTSGDPVDALRQAQLGMLHGRNEGDRSPRAWAAFEVIGASNERQ